MTFERKLVKEEESVWVADACSSIRFHLASGATIPPADDAEAYFHPDFAYPFFGEDEKIYGFKNLSIRVFLLLSCSFADCSYECVHATTN